MNEDRLTLPQIEVVVNALERGQPCGRDRAGVLEVEPVGDVRDLFGSHRDVLGIKAALRIGEAVRVDRVADPQALDARPDRGDSAGAVRPEYQGETRLAFRPPAGTHFGVPRANARRVQPDQHLIRAERRHRERVERQHLGAAEAVERRRPHGRRDGRRPDRHGRLHGKILSGNATRASPVFRPASWPAQNGYCIGSCWMLIQWNVVNSSIAQRPL